MTQNNEALYEKMSAELDKYRDWLLSQPPEEILNHTYEYTVKQDIVMAMEDAGQIGLTDEQTAALLKSKSPLEDVFKDFRNRETDHMDVVRGCIEDRAKAEVQREQEQRDALRQLPVYLYPADYARENGQLDEYRASLQANVACKDAICEAINEHHTGYQFNARAAVVQTVDQFGFDRLMHVCAATIRHKEWDGRISQGNIRWARTMPVYEDKDKFGQDRRIGYVIPNHSTLVDSFVETARHEYLLTLPLTPEEIKGEALRILAQFQEANRPNSPDGKHYAVRVTPLFMERAGDKTYDMLGKLLPFQSLTLTSLKERSGIYAVISGDENRFQKLKPVRASVLEKLQRPLPAASAKKRTKKKEQER